MNKKNGVILKGIGGFYYVESEGKVYECKARGVFRKKNMTPSAGDKVIFSLSDPDNLQYALIEEILPRQNQLIRPPIANIDQLLIVASTCDPKPNTLVIDKLVALACYKGITPIIVISKIDLEDGAPIYKIYQNAKVKTVLFSGSNQEGLQEIKDLLKGKITAFTGNSGVGKSTLLNCIDESLSLKTGETSKKLGRGRHTTREVELFKLKFGGYVADTPGFSSIDLAKFDLIRKDELQYCFKDFEEYIKNCKFASCSHLCEKGCKVIEAVNSNDIEKSRYESYVSMYQSAKEIKEWEQKSNLK